MTTVSDKVPLKECYKLYNWHKHWVNIIIHKTILHIKVSYKDKVDTNNSNSNEKINNFTYVNTMWLELFDIKLSGISLLYNTGEKIISRTIQVI